MVSKQQLGPLELVDVVALLLPRFACTLISLDLRFVEIALFNDNGHDLGLQSFQ